nr:right-handed parallel beta-helix repeat-containing protein [uncultured Bacteroides sp.]
MNLKKALCLCLVIAGSLSSLNAAERIYDLSQMGLKADSKKNASPILQRAIKRIQSECTPEDSIVLRFAKGKYNFHEAGSAERVYYISNHDQDNPKKVGIALEGFKHLTLEGNGAELIFHGRMIPLSLLHSENCTLRDFSIDFATPHITQIQVLENDAEKGITFKPAPWVNWRITKDSIFESYGDGWIAHPSAGIAFEEKTRHIVYNTSDLPFSTKGVSATKDGALIAPQWKDSRLIPGTIVAMRMWSRPTPGIFLSENRNTIINNVKVHYAEGMGLLAQLCDNITLEDFGICLKGSDDPRYFTTQADATHFSGCKGKIISRNGLYEGMMDDAINVHGTYLKVVKRMDDHTLVGRYMHGQAWGFKWGEAGDSVQFVRSNTMEIAGQPNRITAIVPFDREQVAGAREFKITFRDAIDPAISEQEGFGIENLTWTPEVEFSGNTIRNNRARGTLFSTPQKVVVENNLFDHTSGAAILLCGDCNGWYETGACRNVLIRKNRFINALTNQFQFTNAIISIYPEIPNLEGQKLFFHGGKEGSIIIEENEFDTFDAPILYAKSVDGLIFRNNTIKHNDEYKPLHWNRSRFWLEKVNRVRIME